MGYLARVLIRATVVAVFATVFLYPGISGANQEKRQILILVCSCGKPAFAMLANPEGVMVEGIPPVPKAVEACKGLRETGEVIVLKVESYTKESCPVSI